MPVKKITEIELNEDTDADIRETINTRGETTKIINYSGKVRQNEVYENNENEVETENQDENYPFENNNHFPVRESEEIPKDKIDIFFDKIREALPNEQESFYLRLVRVSDGFDDNFVTRCNDTQPLGLFPYYLRDEFRLPELIQKRNNNSGGRFNVIAYDRIQKPLQVAVGFEFNPETRQREAITNSIVARDVFIPNPIQVENLNNNDSQTFQMFEKMMENQNRQFDRMFQAIQNNQSREPQRTLLDSLNELKLVKELTEPPKDNDSNFRILQNEILQAKIINQLIKDDAPVSGDSNEAWWQIAMKSPEIVNLAKEVGLTAFNGINQLMLAKQFTQQNTTPVTAIPQAPPLQLPLENPVVPAPTETNEQPFNEETMKLFNEITTKILNELKTTNPIDENNKVLQELTSEYPQAYPMIKQMVKNLSFDDTLTMLEDITDFDALGLLDDDGDFNTGGLMVKSRLKEFYEFLRK